eukprot:541470_1
MAKPKHNKRKFEESDEDDDATRQLRPSAAVPKPKKRKVSANIACVLQIDTPSKRKIFLAGLVSENIQIDDHMVYNSESRNHRQILASLIRTSLRKLQFRETAEANIGENV